jgi:hypothetical protein
VIGGDASDPQGFAEMLAEASLRSGKPVLYALTGDFGPSDTAEFLAAHGVATAPSAERALRAYLRIVLSASRESGPRLTTGSPDSGA